MRSFEKRPDMLRMTNAYPGTAVALSPLRSAGKGRIDYGERRVEEEQNARNHRGWRASAAGAQGELALPRPPRLLAELESFRALHRLGKASCRKRRMLNAISPVPQPCETSSSVRHLLRLNLGFLPHFLFFARPLRVVVRSIAPCGRESNERVLAPRQMDTAKPLTSGTNGD